MEKHLLQRIIQELYAVVRSAQENVLISTDLTKDTRSYETKIIISLTGAWYKKLYQWRVLIRGSLWSVIPSKKSNNSLCVETLHTLPNLFLISKVKSKSRLQTFIIKGNESYSSKKILGGKTRVGSSPTFRTTVNIKRVSDCGKCSRHRRIGRVEWH